MTRIVVDASVLVAALMADGRARFVLLHSQKTLYVPAFVFAEVERHVDAIAKRARLDRSTVLAALEVLRSHLEELPHALLVPHLDRARRLADDADAAGDEHYIAAALALDAPIWTYDDDFRRVKGVRVCSTRDVEGEPVA